MALPHLCLVLWCLLSGLSEHRSSQGLLLVSLQVEPSSVTGAWGTAEVSTSIFRRQGKDYSIRFPFCWINIISIAGTGFCVIVRMMMANGNCIK